MCFLLDSGMDSGEGGESVIGTFPHAWNWQKPAKKARHGRAFLASVFCTSSIVSM